MSNCLATLCIRVVCVFIVTLWCAGQVAAEAPEGYALAWSDESDTDGPPDDAKWRFERGFVRNQELQWYQADNARCEQGLLVIEGRREPVANPRHDGQSRDWRRQRPAAEYTSASLNTRGRYAWQYGVLEVRAKIEAEPGLWPAIWTLGVAGGWPAGGEVDVMEYYEDSILANACWAPAGRRRPRWDTTQRPIDEFGQGWADEFHVWRMWWDATSIWIEVDGNELNAIDLERVAEEVGDRPHPFRQPHYLLLNLAIGGDRGGDPSNTQFPSRYLIDYVRVYQRSSEVESADSAGESSSP